MSQAINATQKVLTSTINPINPQLAQGKVGADTTVDALTPKLPAAPVVETPAVAAPIIVPGTDDAKVQAARRRSVAEQLARRGRASTVLTQAASSGGDKLGV